ncbi:hypothetical protein [Paracoccus sp. IB05]|uniref:hypothetical protein n=1 Tax=Paracoccus sp. IB05 TaxID=2779367 RepID=UPI0018E72303|nr:hypothetical protein [Paracoccus sp. IB05]MBJ2153776.1 hypothetical protein [Paracoccus sp. IB05]
MSPDTFRLILATCAVWLTLACLFLIQPLVAMAALLFAALWIVGAAVWWGWKWWNR